MKILKAIKKAIMARVEHVPIPVDDKSAALAAIAAYKAQNPVKYETKKKALFAKYGLDEVADSVDATPDANDVELEELKKKVAKKAPKKVTKAKK